MDLITLYRRYEGNVCGENEGEDYFLHIKHNI
jgi:hypothetical protein